MAEPSGCAHENDRGYGIHTFTGNIFYPEDVRDNDVSIIDIAHGLSMTCRYAGQSDVFYSVAQHSVHCWEMAEDLGLSAELKKEALLHDSVEAYLGADFPRPYKLLIPELVEFESMIEEQLNPIIGIPVHKSADIKFIDETMLATEMPLLFQKHGGYKLVDGDYSYTGSNYIIAGLPDRLNWNTIQSWSPEKAESRFLEIHHDMLDNIRDAA